MTDFNDEAMQSYPFAQITPPLNWSLVALEDISADVSPGFASGKHNSDGAGIPHLRPMNVDREGQIDLNVVKSVAESNGIELQPGDVLFNNTNSAELVGKTAVVSTREIGFAFSNHMTRIRLEFGVNPAFAARQLHFLWMVGYMKNRCTNHVNQASISSKTLAKTIPFLLPPDEEQTRIVAKLEELLSDLDAGVAELKAAQKKLGQYRQSLLKAAVEGTLSADWRTKNKPAETGAQLLERILQERRARWEAKQLAKFESQGKAPPKDLQKKYPEPVQPDITGLPELPEGWVWATIDQLGEVVSGFAYKSTDFCSTGIPVTKIANIGYGVYESDGSQEFLPSHFLKETSDFVVSGGDILIALTRPITNGTLKSCLYPQDLPPSLLNQRVAAIKTAPPTCNDYIFLISRTPYFREKVRSSTSETLQPNMSPNALKAIVIPLPPPSETTSLVEITQIQLIHIEQQEVAISLSLKQSSAQRQNILRAAFAGQLVPQNPDDEPASMLLERIRAERAKRDALKGPRGRKTKVTA